MAKKKAGSEPGPGRVGRPKHKGTPLMVRLKPGLLEAFRAHVHSMRPQPTVTAVIEWLMEDLLIKAGKWPPPAEQQGDVRGQ